MLSVTNSSSTSSRCDTAEGCRPVVVVIFLGRNAARTRRCGGFIRTGINQRVMFAAAPASNDAAYFASSVLFVLFVSPVWLSAPLSCRRRARTMNRDVCVDAGWCVAHFFPLQEFGFGRVCGGGASWQKALSIGASSATWVLCPPFNNVSGQCPRNAICSTIVPCLCALHLICCFALYTPSLSICLILICRAQVQCCLPLYGSHHDQDVHPKFAPEPTSVGSG